MKTPEDEAFDDLAKRQGAWGGGFPAKRAMAADKLQETVSFPCCGYTDAIKWNQFNGVVQCHMCGQVYTVAQPAQKPVAWPKATPEEQILGWTLDYKFLESLSDTADGRPSMETVESVLLLAVRQVQSVAPPQPAQEPAEWLTGCPTCGMDAGCDCDTGTWNPPQPAQEQWNAALDEAAARIGEIKGFGQATQDSFAVYIKGLKR
jgi:hypothetical protein